MRLEVCLCSLFLLIPASCSESDAAASDSNPEATTVPGEEVEDPVKQVADPVKDPVVTPEVTPEVSPPAKEPEQVPAPTKPAVEENFSIEIINAILVDDTVLLGGQPNEAQLAEAADKGYQVIVSTRGEEEAGTDWEEAAIEELDMRFVRIPMASGGGFTEENARALAALLEDPANHPIMVHCGSGNRVGGLFALKAFYVDGMEPEQALEIGRSHGMQNRIEGKVRASMK